MKLIFKGFANHITTHHAPLCGPVIFIIFTVSILVCLENTHSATHNASTRADHALTRVDIYGKICIPGDTEKTA